MELKKQHYAFFRWVAIIIVATFLYAAYSFNVFVFQKTTQLPSKTTLEEAWWLSEGDLIDVKGKLYIWPYRDLWKQRYTFVWAPQKIDFRLYNFTYEDAKRYLHELWANWTTVRGIMEQSMYASDQKQFNELKEHFGTNGNISLISDASLGIQYQHAKTFVFDTWFIIQTANLTFSSFSKNRELFFFGTDMEVRDNIQLLFEKDREDTLITQDMLHPNLVVCPFNCRTRLEALLNHAQKSIVMYQQYIADKRIQDILKEKYKQWVIIKIILWDRADAKNINSPEESFYASLSWSIKKQSSPYVHAKGILVDDRYFLLSSMNISETSIDKNREIGILLINRFHIEKFMDRFLRDWVE